MNVPTPNHKEIEELSKLYEAKSGVKLSNEGAELVATKLLQLYYIAHYPVFDPEWNPDLPMSKRIKLAHELDDRNIKLQELHDCLAIILTSRHNIAFSILG